MKIAWYSLFLMGFIIFLGSCECTKVECAEENPALFFRVIDAVDSTDLLFGSDPALDFQDFQLISVDNFDTTFIDVSSSYINTHNEQFFLKFRTPDVTLSRVFIDYGDMNVDIIDITSSRYSDECCEGRIITNVAHNGVEVFSSSPSSVVLFPK